MKKYFLILIIIAVAFVIGIVYIGKGLTPLQNKTGKPVVAATICPLYDIARNVAGDYAEVKLILPPGASPHLFEFSPRQLEELQGTNVVFAIGHGLDNWATRVENVTRGAEVVVVDSDIAIRLSEEEEEEEGHEHGPADPHYWLHFGNARQIADNIANKLSEIDFSHVDIYKANAEAYKEKLAAKEEELKRFLTSVQSQSILTFHDAWFYFADNFQLEIAGTFEPASSQEPTPRYLADLQQKIKERKIRIIFLEPQLSSVALGNFAKDNDLVIAELDPLGGVAGRETYLELMEFNVRSVRQAFQERNQ